MPSIIAPTWGQSPSLPVWRPSAIVPSFIATAWHPSSLMLRLRQHSGALLSKEMLLIARFMCHRQVWGPIREQQVGAPMKVPSWLSHLLPVAIVEQRAMNPRWHGKFLALKTTTSSPFRAQVRWRAMIQVNSLGRHIMVGLQQWSSAMVWRISARIFAMDTQRWHTFLSLPLWQASVSRPSKGARNWHPSPSLMM